MSTELKVGAVVLIAVAVLAVFILNLDETSRFFRASTEVYRVQVRFDSISGLGVDAPVRLAGVPVGRVEGPIRLTDDGQALVTLRIDNGVILRDDSTASVSSEGLLGEKYLELTAGTPGGPVVGDGGFILAGAAVSLDQMVTVMNEIAGDARQMTNAMSNVFGTEAGETRMAAILANLEQLTADVGAITRSNRDAIGASVANIEELTAALAGSLPQVIENYRALATEATALVSGNINSGDGTAAQLINTSDTIEKLNSSLDTIDDSLAAFDSFFNRAGQTQFSFALRSEWYGNDEATKNYFGFRIGLGPRNDRAFIFELVNDNIGLPTVNTFITETLDPGGEVIGVNIERITARDDAFKFSALLAARFDQWQFRGGLMESEAGVGIDLFSFNDRLRFSLDGWDFGRNPDPHIKLGGQFDVWDRVFITAGADDLLSSDFRQFFIGAGFKYR